LHVADSRLATATGEWREIEPTYREPGWLAPPDFALPQQPSIVVLPLDVLHADEDSRLLADALIHDVITRLGRLRWLFVIARGTAFAFRGQNQDPREISRKLGVGFVLQGSAQFHDKRIRLNVALSDALSSGELWAEQFDRALEDIFGIQDEIADVVVSRVTDEIEQSESRRAFLAPLASLDAWSALHRGSWHLNQHTAKDYDRAEYFFDIAAKLDPRSARVFAGLSAVHRQRAFLNLSADPKKETDQAFELAEKSISLDPYDPHANWAFGRALILRKKVEPALDAFEAATIANPSFAIGHYSVGFARQMIGKNEVSCEAISKARRLSPYDPMIFSMLAANAVNAAMRGKHEEAAQLADQAARRPNAHYHILAIAALCHAMAGNRGLAQGHVRHLRDVRSEYSASEFLRVFPYQDAKQIALFRKTFRTLGLPG
jgi:TolB-like protein